MESLVVLRNLSITGESRILFGEDDVLTLLTHFGYLTYDTQRGAGWLPNYEVRKKFGRMIHHITHKETIRRLQESEQFLKDIIAGNENAVAANIQNVHMRESAPIWYSSFCLARDELSRTNTRTLNESEQKRSLSLVTGYNNEQALHAIVKLAFFTYRDHYIKLEELPGGTGYADLAYIPKRMDPSPALIIELKAGGTPQEAMEQIRSRNYSASVDGLGTGVVLVAVTYDKDDKTKPHHCRIERL